MIFFLIKKIEVPALIQNQEINPSFKTDKEIDNKSNNKINKKRLW